MNKKRVNICLTPELVERLKLRGNVNWSEIAEAALWRIVREESLEQENAVLRDQVKRLIEKVTKIKEICDLAIDTSGA